MSRLKELARLMKELATGAENSKTAISYHDPCCLKKSLGVAAQPRALLQENTGCPEGNARVRLVLRLWG